MPGPSSVTRRTTRSGSSRSSARVTVTRAVCGVCVSALVTRLPTTCRSRASSPSTTGTSVSDGSRWSSIGRSGCTARASCTASPVDLGQVHRDDDQRALLVEPGQQQQVLDEQPHAGALGLDPLHQPADVLG